MKTLKKFFILLILTLVCCHCQSLPKGFSATPSYFPQDTSSTKLAQRFKAAVHRHVQQSGFYALDLGNEALTARLATARDAEKTLDVQYYIWHDDMAGKIFMHTVLEAADRGVRVRLLLDDLNIGPYEDQFLVLASHPNIEVRMFNPFANRKLRFFEITRFEQANRRMHNKTFIVDNQVAIVGGRNIGNEYFMAGQEMNFGDYDVWMVGPIVPEVSKSFDRYWNHELAIPLKELNHKKIKENELQDLRASLVQQKQEVLQSEFAESITENDLSKKIHDGSIPLNWAIAWAIYDAPEKLEGQEDVDTHRVLKVQSRLSAQASQEMFFVSPYFIPGDGGVEFLKKQIANGVKVVVLTNSLASTDVLSVFPGYRKYRQDLLRIGVELYELKPRAVLFKKASKGIGSSGSRSGLHAKVYVFDRDRMFIGSMNLDPRSLELNSELGILAKSKAMASQFVEPLYNRIEHVAYRLKLAGKNQDEIVWSTREGHEVVEFTSEPEVGTWKKMKTFFYSLVMPESLL